MLDFWLLAEYKKRKKLEKNDISFYYLLVQNIGIEDEYVHVSVINSSKNNISGILTSQLKHIWIKTPISNRTSDGCASRGSGEAIWKHLPVLWWGSAGVLLLLQQLCLESILYPVPEEFWQDSVIIWNVPNSVGLRRLEAQKCGDRYWPGQ